MPDSHRVACIIVGPRCVGEVRDRLMPNDRGYPGQIGNSYFEWWHTPKCPLCLEEKNAIARPSIELRRASNRLRLKSRIRHHLHTLMGPFVASETARAAFRLSQLGRTQARRAEGNLPISCSPSSLNPSCRPSSFRMIGRRYRCLWLPLG
jgi:hypothetical protein